MNANAQVTITMDIVDIEGRSMEGVKFLGMIPEAVQTDAHFSLYVRWDIDYGVIKVDRSDTDESLVTVGLARKGKLDAFQMAMHSLASRYGVTVTVQADPGVKVSAMAAKMIGTYAPAEHTVKAMAPSTLVVGPGRPSAKPAGVRPDRCAITVKHTFCPVFKCAGRAGTAAPVVDNATIKACSVAGCKTGKPAVMLLKIATGPSAKYTNDTFFCGVCWPWYRTSTELGNVVESIAQIHSRDYVTEAEIVAIGADNHCSNGRCGTCHACHLAMCRHLVGDPFGMKVTVGGFDNAGTDAFPVAATLDRTPLDESDIAEANAQAWSEAGCPRDDQGQPIIPILPALPVRTPGAAKLAKLHADFDAWDREESAIWAGTDQVARMRFPRKMKKDLRRFAIAQSMAMPRRIDVKRARVAKGW